MLNKSEGIVLHSIKYGDSGRIVHIYTEKDGLISLIAQGFGSKSTVKKFHFQSLNLLDISYYFKKNNSIQRLKEAKLISGVSNEGNLNKLSMQVFISELLYKSIKEEEKNDDLYNFIKNWIVDFHNQKSPNLNSHLHFTLNLSKYLGFYPNESLKGGKFFNLRDGIFEMRYMNDVTLTLEDSEKFYCFINEGKVNSNRERKIILNILLEYYKNHIEQFHEMKSKAILEEVFS